MFKAEFLFRQRKAKRDDHEEELERLILFPNVFESLCALSRCLLSEYELVAVADCGTVGILDVVSQLPDGKARARFYAPVGELGLLEALAQTHRLAGNGKSKQTAVRIFLMRECGIKKDEFSLGLHLKPDAFMKALDLCRETGLELSQIINSTMRLDEALT